MLQSADVGDSFVVAVVVDQRHSGSLSCDAYQEVGRRNTTVISAGCEQILQLVCSLPQLGAHRHSLKCVQTLGDFSCPRLVGRQADELDDDEVADENATVGHLGVEP